MSVLKIRRCISVLISTFLIIAPLFTIITPITSNNTAYALEPDTSLANADASFIGEVAGDQSGYSISSAGDINGDGYDDLLIGAWANDAVGSNSGQTYLVLGNAHISGMDLSLANVDASFIGEVEGDMSGYSVCSAGDVNNDGYDDFLIGAPDNFNQNGNDAGQTYLILGKSAADWGMDYSLANADASFIGESASDRSGRSVASAGDINNDGYDDFLIGAYWNDEGGTDCGQTYMIFGKATADWGMDFSLANADASFIGEGGEDYSGLSIASAGDVNNDGYYDFLIGAFQNNGGGRSDAGKTYLILGKSAANWGMDFDLALSDASFIGENASDFAGVSVSLAGDVNSDGFSDFLIGAYQSDDGGSNAGQTYLILGKAAADWGTDYNLSNSDASFIGTDTDGSGRTVSHAGDINRDNYDDFLIGAYANDESATDAGQTFVILGTDTADWGMDYSLSKADASFYGENASDRSSRGLNAAGDVNGDGYDDFLTGAYLNDDGGSDAGQTYLILGEPTWRTETLDAGPIAVYQRSLAFDNNGYPGISYQYGSPEYDLKYTHWNGSSWDTVTIDSYREVGTDNSLAYDQSGNPGISYQDYYNRDLKYAYWNGSSWEISVVDYDGDVGWHTSIAFDADGNPGISYSSDSGQSLKYAHWNGASWDITTVEGYYNGHETSLAYRSDGNPIIAYTSDDNPHAIKCAVYNGTLWTIQIVDNFTVGSGSDFSYPSLAIDSTDNPGISYYDEENDRLKYAYYSGDSWNIEVVDSSSVTGMYTSLCFDKLNKPFISYFNDTNTSLKYAWWNGNSWNIEILDEIGSRSTYSSCAIDVSGNVGVAYFNNHNATLKYASLSLYDDIDPTVAIDNIADYITSLTTISGTSDDNISLDKIQVQIINTTDSTYWDGSRWENTASNIEIIDQSGIVIESTSLAFNSNGNAVISYHDNSSDDLKLARWNGSEWTSETLNSTGTLGYFCSLALDDNDNPAISSFGTGGLNYTYWNGNTWVADAIHGSLSASKSSLAFDTQGNPAISYYSASDSDLRFMRWNGSAWNDELVDFDGIVGHDNSLAFSNNNNPAISYWDGTNYDLKYASWDGSSWDIKVVDSEGDVGEYASLAFDNDNFPAISYYDETNQNLKLAHWNGTIWDIETVDTNGNVGAWCSLAFGDDGYPAISYTDYSNHNLKYAHWNGNNWDIATVDDNGSLGTYTSLAFDSNGNPTISYSGDGQQELKLAHLIQGLWLDVTGTTSWSYSMPSLIEDKIYSVKARAIDGSGNTSNILSDSFINEATDPTVTIDDIPDYIYSLEEISGTALDALPGELDKVQIAISNTTDNTLWDGDSWVAIDWNMEIVDSTGDVGWYTSLAFDKAGNPAISYQDSYNLDLKFAQWNGSAWDIEIVDPTIGINSYNSLVFDNNGNPAISYRDESDSTLKFALFNGSSWDIETVDSVGAAGKHTSLGFDGSGNPAISYKGTGFDDLKYAHWNGSSWDIETVTSSSYIDINYTSLAFDNNDNPAISYSDDINNDDWDLKIAWFNGSSWDISTVDNSSSRVGHYASLVFDSTGNPAIGYLDHINGDLKYARWNGSSWGIDTVDSEEWVGQYSSLALDSSDLPAISYYDNTNQNLKYACWNGIAWDIEILDSSGVVGRYDSLAFDNDGNPAVSYSDESSDDLKYIRLLQADWLDATGTATWSYGMPSLTEDKAYSVKARAIDTTGNYSSIASDSFIYDTTSPLSITFDGWYVNEGLVTTATKSDTVSAKISLSGGDAGSYTLRIRRDISLSGDATVQETTFTYDGTTKTVELAFVTPYTTGENSTNGYHVDLYYGGLEAWALSDSYPPRLTVVSGVSPAAPTNQSPSDGAISLNFTPTLESSEFSDPDSGDTHAASQWQVTATAGDYSSPVYDSSTDTGNKVSTTIPTDVLDNTTTYYWRVRHQDNVGGWSVWSAETAFSTMVFDDGSAAYNFATAQGTSNVDCRPGATTYPEIYFYNVDGNRVTHISMEAIDIPVGWTVAFEPVVHSQDYISGAQVTTIQENLYVEPSEVQTGPIDPVPTGTISLAIPDKLGDGVPGYALAKMLRVVITAPVSATIGTSADVTVKGTASWIGQAGAADIVQQRGFNFTVDVTSLAQITPTNTTPSDQAIVESLTPTLGSSAFSDSDSGDTHAASRWQITTTSGDYSDPEYDSNTDISNKTSITIPTGAFDANTTYYWRVRHQDNHGDWSEWSAETSFITVNIIEETIGSAGGTIEAPDQNIIIVLPTGAVDNDTPVILTIAQPDQMPPTPSGCTLCSTVFTIEGVETLGNNATITVSYTAADVTAAGGNANLLSLYRYDEDSEQWVRLPTTVDTTEQTLTVTTDHFSLWATMVRPLNFWERSRMWFLVAGAIVAGVLLLLIIKSSRGKLIMAGEVKQWEEEGYDLTDWKDKLGIK